MRAAMRLKIDADADAPLSLLISRSLTILSL
jgi:hypothetical protein